MRDRFHVPDDQIEKTAAFLKGLGLSASDEPNVTNFKGQRVSISLYGNGTAIVNCDDPMMVKLLKDYFETVPFDYLRYISGTLGVSLPSRWIGTDEAGKGDYFGPLVVAGVCLDAETASLLYRRGISDSKKFSAPQLLRFEHMLIQILPASAFDVITISPEKYNELHAKMGNVLDMLVWAHARVIKNLNAKMPCEAAVVDKFASGAKEKELASSVPGVTIHQFTKGEREIAVASASILASSSFNRALDSMSEQCGFRLLKGAGADVKELASRILREKGSKYYSSVAKSDFVI